MGTVFVKFTASFTVEAYLKTSSRCLRQVRTFRNRHVPRRIHIGKLLLSYLHYQAKGCSYKLQLTYDMGVNRKIVAVNKTQL